MDPPPYQFNLCIYGSVCYDYVFWTTVGFITLRIQHTQRTR